jgi:hypothetical protein
MAFGWLKNGGREVSTQLACIDTREHTSELVSWREMASDLLKSGLGGYEVDARCVDMREKADELASWRGGLSKRLETWGCAVTSAECDLRKRGAGKALDAREPARRQRRDGDKKSRRQHRHLTHSDTD